MKKCIDCECLYPDYYEKCPACSSTNKKEWKQSDKKNLKEEKIENQSIENEDIQDIVNDFIGETDI